MLRLTTRIPRRIDDVMLPLPDEALEAPATPSATISGALAIKLIQMLSV